MMPWILLILLFFQGPVLAGISNPLEPVDTSSPRATLQGYLQNMRDRYDMSMGKGSILQTYMDSGQLFLDENDFQRRLRIAYMERDLGSKYLDLRDVAAANQDQVAWRLSAQLKEIIDRVALPPMNEVPDSAAMASRQFKRWHIPGTDIYIAQVDSGPREGEYLFSRDTVARIPDYFTAMRSLPHIGTDTQGLYDFNFLRPTGLAVALHRVIPPRWVLGIPEWTYLLVFDQPLWRWLAMVVLFGGCLVVLLLCRRICLAYARRHSGAAILQIVPPLLTMLMVPWVLDILSEVLKVSPWLFNLMMVGLWLIFYAALPWLLWLLGGLAAEFLIQVNGIRNTNVDGQLIRLLVRLVALVLSVCVLMDGANRIGLPAYSVLAGLGIGGLAVALAGQQALANLLGSLIIMLERPFRIGHSIRTSGMEGRVEDIGFRSALLRTPENTLLVVPCSALVHHTIENLTLRRAWRIKRTLMLENSCRMAAVKTFKEAILQLLAQHDDIRNESICVGLTQISLNGFELFLDFAMKARDEHDQIRKTDLILCSVAELAEQHGIVFSQRPDAPLKAR